MFKLRGPIRCVKEAWVGAFLSKKELEHAFLLTGSLRRTHHQSRREITDHSSERLSPCAARALPFFFLLLPFPFFFRSWGSEPCPSCRCC
jgi:hypothetical protein